MPAQLTALGSEPRPGGGPSAEDDVFGLWLRRQLHQCYAAIIAEPIPEELLRLIEGEGHPSAPRRLTALELAEVEPAAPKLPPAPMLREPAMSRRALRLLKALPPAGASGADPGRATRPFQARLAGLHRLGLAEQTATGWRRTPAGDVRAA